MKRTLWILASLALIAGFGFGGYRLYEGHLSSALKRILIAATDPAASENDVRVYVRDARLQVRTEKDAAILNKFQQCIQLAKDSSEIKDRIFNETMGRVKDPDADYSQFDALVKLRSQYWESNIPVPKTLQADMTQALAEAKTRHAERKKQDDADDKRADSEEAKAKALYIAILSDLGQPLPEKKK